MEIIADLHMHTNATAHAYSTIGEMAAAAQKRNLKLIAITEHGTGTNDAPHIGFFANYEVVSDEICGVRVLGGAETGLKGPSGDPDIPEFFLKRLDFVIASMHCDAMPTYFNKYDYTNAYVKALENPYIDAVGHLLRYDHPIIAQRVVKAARDNNKIVEINELSFKNPKYKEKFLPVLLLCKEYGVKIMLSTDSHHSSLVGKVDKAKKLAEEVNYPEELIINTSTERLLNYLNGRPLKDKIILN